MKRILLIDDDHITNMLNERIIKYTQVAESVHVCISAQKALNLITDIIDKQESIPEVILLDIRMPIMDGFGFLEEFAKIPESITSDVKIAMLTSSLEDSEKDRAYKYKNVIDFINKPLNEVKIREFIKKAETTPKIFFK